jgi:predicted dehydrogenase
VNQPVRVGLVGLGFGCLVHAPAFRADPRCRVTAVAGRDAGRAAASAEQLGGVRAFPDWRALVGTADVDVVAIAVPPRAQPAIVVEAARAGKHVFCEKPLAASLADAQEALEAVQAAGVVHAIDFTFPEIGAWQRARSLLMEGAVGRVLHFTYRWHVESYASRANLDTWKQRPEDGGGALGNFGSHVLHDIEWLLGPIGWIGAAVPASDARLGRAVAFTVRLENGAEGHVDIATDAFLGEGHRIEIHGEQGTLVLANPGADYASGFFVQLGTRKSGRLTSVVEPAPATDGDGRVAAVGGLVRRFVDAIGGGDPVSPNLIDGVRVQRLLDAASEPRALLQPVLRARTMT